MLLFHLTDEILSVNPSASVFAFWDLTIHHKECLTYSGGADRPGELCYNFSISNDLIKMVNFPTQIPDGDSQSPTILDLFIYSDTSNYLKEGPSLNEHPF